jgi:hypothetical protein
MYATKKTGKVSVQCDHKLEESLSENIEAAAIGSEKDCPPLPLNDRKNEKAN